MIGTSERLGGTRGPRSLVSARTVGIAVLACGAVVGGAAVGYLVAGGHWYMALGLLLALPLLVLVYRYPLAAITIWLLVAPFVSVTDVGTIRKLFWVIHRALPLVALAVIVFGSISGVRTWKLPKLGWAEAMMGGYVLVSVLSIAYTSTEPLAAVYLLHDRVIVPICLYLIIRLLDPSDRDLRRLVPPVVFVLLTQSAIGLVQWVAPGAVPSAWAFDAARTTGSFHDPDVFGATMLFCGVFLLWAGLSGSRRPARRMASVLLFVLAMTMVFLTLSRANWLAGILVVAGALIVYRRHLRWLVAIAVPITIVLLASGVLAGQIRFAQERLRSSEAQESALARLPVAYAALHMLEAKPLTGWGYLNFDRYSRPFQVQVGNLVYPEKDHASHNLFLTILAEQGIVGFVLFVGPMVVWLAKTRRSLPGMPPDDRRLVGGLWLVTGGFILVNSFSVMKVTFGLGLWWMTLGMIAVLVDRYRPEPMHGSGAPPDDEPASIAAGTEDLW